eukprot:6763381-Prorocentrum_lima.AAC.1
MTSSLVGSEMCIRDSYNIESPMHIWDGIQQCYVTSHDEEMSDEVELYRPVSYTHLTLPTICSV